MFQLHLTYTRCRDTGLGDIISLINSLIFSADLLHTLMYIVELIFEEARG